ncbi:hypothetical protein L3X38_015637 [Prunus dulcis]|uniref:Uncharacterized protein n=1 Tax=Prunus dulcis TaxID=3755 RepID=A0AAD4Z820_PRUDU|nr:hypothetical protein L3X38_015637 [Prunus dulcis]
MDQSPENIFEVTTPTRLVHLEDKSIGYQLPFRQNRGKPPNRYSPDIGKTSKYPIANHVSTEKLSEPFKAFVHQLSTIHIPTQVAVGQESSLGIVLCQSIAWPAAKIMAQLSKNKGK